MGYNNLEIFAGKDCGDHDIYGGFRFVIGAPHGAVIDEALLHLYLERMYPASLAQDALDHFTDVDDTDLEAHTMDVGPPTGWVMQNPPEDIMIMDNGAYPHPSYGEIAIYTVDVDTANGRLIVNTHIYSSGTQIGLVFRFSDTDNYWLFKIGWVLGGVPLLRKVVAGVATDVDTSGALAHAGWYTQKVVLDGDNIKCYLDGVLILETTDSALSGNTEVGLYCLYTSIGVRWEDFEFIPSGTPDPLLWARCDDVGNSEPFCESLNFAEGSVEFTTGGTLVGLSSSASGTIEEWVMTSGTWAGGDAAGTVYLSYVLGVFIRGEILRQGLLFDSGSVEFTVGEVLTGNDSGATGTVGTYFLTGGKWGDGDAAGTVILTGILGTYVDDEALNGSVGGGDMATADGGATGADRATTCERLNFDDGSVEFTAGEILTGASSGAASIVEGWTVTSGAWVSGNATGMLYLSLVAGTYTDDELLNGSIGGSDMATADGTSVCTRGNLPDTKVLTTDTQSLGDISGWTEDDWNITCDIKLPVQEVLDRPDWSAGNHLSVILMPQVTEDIGSKIRVKSFERDADLAAKLYLHYYVVEQADMRFRLA